MEQRSITPELFDALIDVIEHKINLRSINGKVKSKATEEKLDAIRLALFGSSETNASFVYSMGYADGYNARIREYEEIYGDPNNG
jgi:hypothetical protein